MILGGTHDQRPLDQQVQLLRGLLGPGMTDGLKLPDQQGMDPPPVRGRLGMSRMVLIREGKVGRKIPTAAEVRVRHELVQPVEQCQEPASGPVTATQGALVPRQILVGGTA